MAKALITTVPFAEKNRLPLELLEKAGIKYQINPYNTKLSERQLMDLIPGFDAIIAGTESISEQVMEQGTNIRFISRVGIGLDSVDLITAKKKGIKVSYTPAAPAPAVAEFTLGLMLTLLRSIHISNLQMHEGKWQRIFGRRLADVSIGIIGMGRIGTRLLRCIRGFDTLPILANDIEPKPSLSKEFNLDWVTKEQIFKEADIISLHVPLTHLTKNMIQRKQLLSMKPNSILINTSRGGIINESDLYNVLVDGHLSGVAIDAFESEPYTGELSKIERCLLTSHMGSMSADCRAQMEIEAVEETIRFLSGNSLENEVPQIEYDIQKQAL